MKTELNEKLRKIKDYRTIRGGMAAIPDLLRWAKTSGCERSATSPIESMSFVAKEKLDKEINSLLAEVRMMGYDDDEIELMIMRLIFNKD